MNNLENIQNLPDLAKLSQSEFNEQMKILRRISKVETVTQEPEPSLFSSFFTLWAATAPDCRVSLINEMLFRTDSFMIRLHREQNLQRKLRDGWKR